MSINATLIVQLIVFLILAWFTMKFVWPPIVSALDERARKVAEGLSAADRAKSELAQANRKIEQELATTRETAAQRLQDAERQGLHIIEDARKRAEEDAARILQQARQDAEQQVAKARNVLRDQVAELAVKGAEAILRREVNPQAHAELLGRLKAEL